jgi:hypothetical protein
LAVREPQATQATQATPELQEAVQEGEVVAVQMALVLPQRVERISFHFRVRFVSFSPRTYGQLMHNHYNLVRLGKREPQDLLVLLETQATPVRVLLA